MINQVQRILIYGVPVSGKTFYSKILAEQLHVPVIEGDLLKRAVRKGHAKAQSPFLYLGTCQVYKQYGRLGYDTAIRGLLSVRSALRHTILETLN